MVEAIIKAGRQSKLEIMPVKNVEIRVLSSLDVDSFQQLRLRALREEPESFGSSPEEFLKTAPEDLVKRIESTADSTVFGAFNPGLVGILGVQRRQGLKLRHKALIWGVYVAPEGRGLGAGRALMEAAISKANEMPDVQEVILTVAAHNQAARRLYLSMGFEIYGVEHQALKLDDRFVDEEMMFLNL